MSVQDPIKCDQEFDADADLVRVEVPVPAASRADVIAYAASIRKSPRDRQSQLQQHIDFALKHYSVRVFDNIDLSRLHNLDDKARVVGEALMERGDAKAFVLGRQLVDLVVT